MADADEDMEEDNEESLAVAGIEAEAEAEALEFDQLRVATLAQTKHHNSKQGLSST